MSGAASRRPTHGDGPPLSAEVAPRETGGRALAVACAAVTGSAALFAGATTPLGRSALAAVLGLLAAAGALAARAGGGAHVRRVAAALGALGALGLLQTVPLPASVAGWIAPYALSSRVAALGTDGGVPVSLSVDATRRAGLLLVGAAALLAVLGSRLSRRSAPALARGLVLVAVAHGALALALGRYAEDDLLLGRFPVSNVLTAYGAFPNRAQLAAFECVLLGPALWLLVARRGLVERALGACGVALAVASVAGSGSRIGIVGVGVALAWAFVAAPEAGRRRARVIALGVLVAGLGAAALAGPESVRRLVRPRGDEGVRLEVWTGSLRLATVQPVVGIGLDAFRHAYAGDGRGPTDRLVNVAENDALQLATEAGALGLGLLVAAGLAAAGGLRSLGARARASDRREARVAAAGIVGALVESLVGVPLHAPAVALASLCAGALLVALLRTTAVPALGAEPTAAHDQARTGPDGGGSGEAG